jgi:hypothetical protein
MALPAARSNAAPTWLCRIDLLIGTRAGLAAAPLPPLPLRAHSIRPEAR